MKVAVPINGDRIAPRFSLAKEILVAELRGRRATGIEKVDITHLHPMEVPDFLASKGITKIIAGGVDWYQQEIFKLRNIDVTWGIMGNVNEVLAFYLRKGLHLGMGPCPPQRKRRRFRGFQF